MMQVFKRQNNLRCVEASVWLTEVVGLKKG